MKSIILTLFLALPFLSANSQDTITKQNSTDIEVKVKALEERIDLLIINNDKHYKQAI